MTYLLLRDNKQSGPYSLEDLKIKGLKAYDLVWVEGRSAAWRYPSEIGELSAFAPVVEEQPFDRFYKKPAAASGPLTASQLAVAASPEVTLTSKPFYSEDQSSTTRKRTIYVTMPGGTMFFLPLYGRLFGRSSVKLHARRQPSPSTNMLSSGCCDAV